MDMPALYDVIDNPTPASRAVLFAHLANAVAAVRARAADGLLKLYAKQPHRAGLSRDFGSEPEAIRMPCLDELRALIDEPQSGAWPLFIASLELDQDAWRDGTGYNIAALAEVNEIERGAIREMFATRFGKSNHGVDWRDCEVATALDMKDALAKRLDDGDPQTRLRAKEALGLTDDLVAEICDVLANSTHRDTVSKTLDRVADHPTEAVKQALIARVRKVDDQFIYSSMVLLQVFGGVEDAFAERPFLFDVQEQGADGELMQRLIGRVTTRE